MKQDIGLIIDWETSGLMSQEVPYRAYMEGPQGIAIGVILVDLPDFNEIAEFTSEVRFLGKHNGVGGGPIYEGLTWDTDAERIHGYKPVDLVNAPHPTEVAQRFVSFVKTNANIDDPQNRPIMICGHNPVGDLYYTRQLLFIGNMEKSLRFHHRMIDSFTLGYVILGTKNSEELFRSTSNVQRKVHSSIEDARLTLNAFKHISTLCRGIQLNKHHRGKQL